MNKPVFPFLAAFIVIAIQALVPTEAAERVALVVGIDKYPDVPLDNAVRDASAVKAMLTGKLGFADSEIFYAENPDRLAFFETFGEFSKAAADAKIVLLYYAGHGMESLDGRENFLLPVDADILRAAKSEAALEATGINLLDLGKKLSRASSGAKILLMDCCRERPAGRTATSRSGGGLAQYEDARIPSDTLLLLAAAPNRVASDGEKHGPFTEALLEVLPEEGQNLMETFAAVSTRVRERTQERQVPWMKFDGSGIQTFLGTSLFAVGSAPATVTVPMKPDLVPPKPLTAADRIRGASIERPFVNSLGMEFVPVPGKPGVLMCRTETRVRDFRAFAEATDFVQTGGAYVFILKDKEGGGKTTEWESDKSVSWEKPGFTQSGDHPVVCVSWEEAKKFVEWLSTQETGLTYRLPSDVEWSAAVGSMGKYPWGNDFPPPNGAGNYWDREAIKDLPGNWEESVFDGANYNDGAEQTGPVASYKANRFGFFDLGGNVWEWCEDPYRATMNDKDVLEQISGLKNEKSSDGTPNRVVRGDSWGDSIEVALRSSYRGLGRPTTRYANLGFRLVVSAGGGG